MRENTIIDLTVENHPGVMSHVTGLFSRRGFNLEGILCSPLPDGQKSRMYLLLKKDEKLPQIIKQLIKLRDVITADEREKFDFSIFEKLHQL